MGNHQIAVMGDVQGNLAEYTHLFASYMNKENTLNYGGGLFYNREFSSQSIFGNELFFDNTAGGMFFLRYPFTMFSRMDLEGFYENLYRTPYLDSIDVGLINDTTRAATTLNIFTPSLSYVYDDILWGITGPLNGTRSQVRLQLSPPIKHISASFASFDIDFRKYFHLWHRFVWANKFAFGASIPLRNDLPARKFFLGGDENWFLFGYNDYNTKGYQDNINNFFYSDIIVPFRGWGYLDLIGTKFAVFNSEFRFPFIREFSIAWPLAFAIRYVNGAVFVDMGNAWETNQQMKNLPFPDKIYGGFGYGLRANLGIFLLRYDRAWKTDFATFTGPTKDYFSLGAEF
jgi:outer membrane protein assembly factor BamA